MAYKDLLVLIDGTKACAKRIDAAVALAEAHKAHLTGLGVAVVTPIPEYVRQQVPAEVLAEQEKELRQRTEERCASFEAKAKAAGINTETRIEISEPADLVERIDLHGRYSDLMVLGQFDPDDPAWPVSRRLPEQIVLSAGRPALIVPYIGAPEGFGKRVMVAWDAGREAARAVTDALPILVGSEKVTVLTINPRSGPNGHGELAGADIATYLARHGVKVEVQQVESHEIDIADTLLSRMADQGSDLLVMGAYGHARWRELVLGGVTLEILEHMTVPVLMAH
jgi:nucleotide-binding universal stress UspA family protein